MKIRILISFIIFLFITAVLFASKLTPKKNEVTNNRFIKVDRYGITLTSWQGPWACIFDQKQQLLWEVKTDNESIHDGYWTYSWFNGVTGIENSGDCYFEKERCDTLDLITKTNQEKLCGFTGWRLPTEAELRNLIVENDRPGENKIANDYFIQIKKGDYWSGTYSKPLKRFNGHITQGAAAIDFSKQQQKVLPYQNAAFVILVNSHVPKSL
ncbi:DUF1566 domain-containing protein [Pseudoalteromonas denitrificans]|uniref:Lcl C-terminal domain-containing protein n=1 Tax=Pseudoalteromonas denitrificans DSM 6059 TaxID=1123010 RepID=A0A1I1NEB0_9GAMM|nr:DUF1566 domain-containing protein [Pseudoalteromonas denitrificans]SFC92060.1 Protein of unknown function [Pseudoalteromonas denitrificans DSM 6059]